MKISVIGAGYVGLVTGTCFADNGNDVWCVDIDPRKIERLNKGEVPIYEPGLDQMIARNVQSERLRFTTDLGEAVRKTRIVFLCVGTPSLPDGAPDMRYVYAAAEDVGRAMEEHTIIVLKSTVPVGTAAEVRRRVKAVTRHPFDVVSNPEFLKEGAAIDDFLKPDRVVIGTDDPRVALIMKELYEPFVRTGNPILVMDNTSAELTKYGANALLAARISFMNELANLADRVGADIDQVRKGMGTDSRIGHSFLFPGIGFGGSCLVGRETALVRQAGRTRLVRLDALFEELHGASDEPTALAVKPQGLEVLSWSAETGAAEWRHVEAVTRRPFEGETVEVRTKMGRRVRCTPDHPFVVRSGEGGPVRVKLAQDLGHDDWLPLTQRDPENEVAPSSVDVSGVRVDQDSAFWRVAGMFVAGGHATVERLHWTFKDASLVCEVKELSTKLRALRVDTYTPVNPDVRSVRVSVSLDQRLVGWWAELLGAGGDELTRGIPDAVWSLPLALRAAFAAGLWRAMSNVEHGRTTVGTPSRRLADGLERLAGSLGHIARRRSARGEATVATHWITLKGAGSIERLLAASPRDERHEASVWLQVNGARRHPFQGFVYSMEVPGTETFVTTGGLVVHNCFPKDVDALGYTGKQNGMDLKLLSATNDVNRGQKRVLFDKIHARFGGDLKGKRIAVWGLAFKPRTDDMREAPSLTVIGHLLEAGASVHAYDPAATETTRAVLGDRITYAKKQYEALAGADALAICTEWNEFRRPDWDRIKGALKQPLIFDGRNIFDPPRVEELGFEYYGIGRGRKLPASKKG